MVVSGASPEGFAHGIQQLSRAERKDASSEYIVVNAWNEWGEGAMLEPTSQLGFAYLEALQSSLGPKP